MPTETFGGTTSDEAASICSFFGHLQMVEESTTEPSPVSDRRAALGCALVPIFGSVAAAATLSAPSRAACRAIPAILDSAERLLL